jgi:hypothetical protein
MAERVECVGGSDLELERLTVALVVDGHERLVRARLPEEPDVDVVVAPAIQLATSDPTSSS